MRIVLASANAHKACELGRLLEGWEVESFVGALPEETGETFAENARIKARHVHEALAGASWVVADDSGIEAAALGGVPGVRSARYAGDHATDQENLDKLREEAPPGSGLAYVCLLAYVDPATGDERLFEGRCTGTMARDERGDRGFGYDPIFTPEGADLTFGEMEPAIKDAMSHRALAFAKLKAALF